MWFEDVDDRFDSDTSDVSDVVFVSRRLRMRGGDMDEFSHVLVYSEGLIQLVVFPGSKW